ncbi:MAG TPA: hypothetical protein VM260_18205 [Pirellula sp.]|nr:hypothetical protein [Pirellula sp.]
MTADQIMGLLRQVLPVLGALAVSFGWIAPDKVAPITANILAVAGPAMMLGGTIWAILANSKTSIIKSATKMDEVDSNKLAAAITDPQLKAVAKAGGDA